MRIQTIFLTSVVLFVAASMAEPSVTIEHNKNNVASRAFQFKNIASPVKDDLGAKAKLSVVDGELDPNGADLGALTDGLLPTDEDEPGANLFFNAGTSGGRIRFDLGSAVEIARVNTYSWHPNTRGPQLYKLYASDGSDPKFDASPKRGVDPATVGWKFLATVSTAPKEGEDGGQYAVSISDPSAALGKFRYLLFDCYVTEMNDDWGNTFYSEIDVIGK